MLLDRESCSYHIAAIVSVQDTLISTEMSRPDCSTDADNQLLQRQERRHHVGQHTARYLNKKQSYTSNIYSAWNYNSAFCRAIVHIIGMGGALVLCHKSLWCRREAARFLVSVQKLASTVQYLEHSFFLFLVTSASGQWQRQRGTTGHVWYGCATEGELRWSLLRSITIIL